MNRRQENNSIATHACRWCGADFLPEDGDPYSIGQDYCSAGCALAHERDAVKTEDKDH